MGDRDVSDPSSGKTGGRLERRVRQERARREGRLPPGQVLTEKWPVLHHGEVPAVDLGSWDLRVFGRVARPLRLTWHELRALPGRELVCDIHCVTSWSRLDCRFYGVPAAEVLRRAEPLAGARWVMVHSEGGFTTNLTLADLMAPDALLAWQADGRDLAPEHGWPLRLVVPRLYFWKSAKWVRGLELLDRELPGFWERHGYHMRGDPWREERFAGD